MKRTPIRLIALVSTAALTLSACGGEESEENSSESTSSSSSSEAGGDESSEGGEQSSQGLLEVFPAYEPDVDPASRVLLPRADIATETLAAGLAELGWETEDVTAYRTVRAAPPAAEIRDMIKSGGFDAVCFTSSSTVRNLVGIAGKPHTSTVVACIGPATAKTAEEHGLRVDVVAPEASAASLVDALAGYGRSLAHEAAESGEKVRRPSDRRGAARRKVKA